LLDSELGEACLPQRGLSLSRLVLQITLSLHCAGLGASSLSVAVCLLGLDLFHCIVPSD
jgi:hypothetical protein